MWQGEKKAICTPIFFTGAFHKILPAVRRLAPINQSNEPKLRRTERIINSFLKHACTHLKI